MDDLTTLVVSAQNGDKEAFGQIVKRFQDMSYAVSFAMIGEANLAQDAAQDAFIDAFICLPKLRNPAAFPGWFRRIIIKHSDRLIRKDRLILLPLDDVLAIPSVLLGPETQFENKEAQATLKDAIATLTPYQNYSISLTL